MKKYAIGIDIGTTSTKVVLFDERGSAVAQHAEGYPLLALEPGAAEQNPDEIYAAVLTSLKKTIEKSGVKAERIGLLSFSTAMHSLIAVDKEGNPITNSITWADTRSEPFAFKVKSSRDALDLYKRTGVPIHPMTPLFKLMWIKNTSPEIFQRAEKFVGIKDYILFRWFGEWATDYASAAATGLWNMHHFIWDEEALRLADVTPRQLPQLKPTTFYWEGLSERVAKECGLDRNVKVAIGATDGPLSNLGVGAVSPGDVAITIGTSGAIRTTSSERVVDAEGRTFCYPLTENLWVSGGPVNNGGIAFQWVHDLFHEKEEQAAYEEVSFAAETAPAGCEGLVFLPHLTGERAPLWDAEAKGSFIGLTLRHTKNHMVRAVLEGVILNLFQVYRLVTNQVAENREEVKVYATGGFTQSALWKQILADVFQKEVSIPEHTESSCLGAVLLGRFAVGDIENLQEAALSTKDYERVQPQSDNKEIYEDLFLIYMELSKALQSQYGTIHGFQKRHKKESGE
ncbi:gluconate kinase [Fictibacillus nanhaiensis]|uniref:gluconokinase n=1 Tax=Fictibacillus nanhaiensis TaxID=742169 RepID=UPI001C952E55|nr:FGGY family carbohydrate kinase [Fictibacillus nanhaiensis]MBY6037354.1 gluconate kinase [Fictibacillus nanhaiensis]